MMKKISESKMNRDKISLAVVEKMSGRAGEGGLVGEVRPEVA